MKSTFGLIGPAALLSVVACVGITQDPTVKSAPPAASPDVRMLTDAMLPALYEGNLPCADCAGIRYALDVRANHVYFLRMTFLGKGNGESLDDIGAWSISPDANKVILRGGRDGPVMFSIENSETLRKLDANGNPIKSTLNYELRRNASYKPLEPRVMMRGMYSYMADAGLFRECVTQLTLPVSPTGDNAALERAYSAARAKPNQELLVSLDGRIALRPRMEGGGLQQSLLVERFIRVAPGEFCESASSITPSLENTHWRLVQAMGEPVVMAADRSEAFLKLDPIGTKALGFGGCNRFAGSYQLDGNKLRFTNVAMTMMACDDNRNPETRFVQVLNDTVRWSIAGHQLELYDSGDRLVAAFEARQQK